MWLSDEFPEEFSADQQRRPDHAVNPIGILDVYDHSDSAPNIASVGANLRRFSDASCFL